MCWNTKVSAEMVKLKGILEQMQNNLITNLCERNFWEEVLWQKRVEKNVKN